jgi:hypothetical protein
LQELAVAVVVFTMRTEQTQGVPQLLVVVRVEGLMQKVVD